MNGVSDFFHPVLASHRHAASRISAGFFHSSFSVDHGIGKKGSGTTHSHYSISVAADDKEWKSEKLCTRDDKRRETACHRKMETHTNRQSERKAGIEMSLNLDSQTQQDKRLLCAFLVALLQKNSLLIPFLLFECVITRRREERHTIRERERK